MKIITDKHLIPDEFDLILVEGITEAERQAKARLLVPENKVGYYVEALDYKASPAYLMLVDIDTCNQP